MDGEKAAGELSPLAWVEGSRKWARLLVYTNEVMGPIRAVSSGLADSLPAIKLSEEYLQKAGEAAQLRAAMACYRLAVVLRVGL